MSSLCGQPPCFIFVMHLLIFRSLIFIFSLYQKSDLTVIHGWLLHSCLDENVFVCVRADWWDG